MVSDYFLFDIIKGRHRKSSVLSMSEAIGFRYLLQSEGSYQQASR